MGQVAVQERSRQLFNGLRRYAVVALELIYRLHTGKPHKPVAGKTGSIPT